jgi:hypothetical protein
VLAGLEAAFKWDNRAACFKERGAAC